MNIAGKYESNHGDVVITQTENKIKVAYQKAGTCKAKLEGNVVRGQWNNFGQSGLFEWTFDDKGNFTGKYKSGTDKGAMKGKWNGKKMKGASADHLEAKEEPKMGGASAAPVEEKKEPKMKSASAVPTEAKEEPILDAKALSARIDELKKVKRAEMESEIKSLESRCDFLYERNRVITSSLMYFYSSRGDDVNAKWKIYEKAKESGFLVDEAKEMYYKAIAARQLEAKKAGEEYDRNYKEYNELWSKLISLEDVLIKSCQKKEPGLYTREFIRIIINTLERRKDQLSDRNDFIRSTRLSVETEPGQDVKEKENVYKNAKETGILVDAAKEMYDKAIAARQLEVKKAREEYDRNNNESRSLDDRIRKLTKLRWDLL